MTKRMLIDATHAEETRVVVLDGNRLEDFDVETSTKKQLKGNIYLAKVVRVEPSLQAAFVEYGGNRHGFLAFGEIHPDYYQIPVADRQRLLEQQAEEARREQEEEDRAVALEQREKEQARGPETEEIGPAPVERVPAIADAATSDSRSEPDVQSELDASLSPDNALSDPLPIGEIFEDTADRPAQPAAIAIERTTGPVATDDVATRDDPPGEPARSGLETQAVAEPADLPTTATDVLPEAASMSPIHVPGAAFDVSHAEDAETPEEASDLRGEIIPEPLPPETVGGEQDVVEESRERRIPPRFLRNYKIQEVIKRRQILLVQVVKEERGTKGAALTTYLSLAGRYCVLMPNSPRGGGISRKITSANDRRRLKEVIAELDLPRGMGLIVRTAGANRPKPEIKRDCEYLLRLWDDIREHTLRSVAPALIYEEASLIKRAIRDVYSRDIDEIAVDGEDGWKAARDFMRMLMPSHVKKVQLWREPVPLFARYQVDSQLDNVLSPTVQLRSGGYLVINQTEALVAIDVNSGRATRERGIEETALRTNAEAADEVARQLRLRDLAGLIVIDFIDMESKKHNTLVERRLKEALKADRARLQVGHISHFGLLEMSRQRMRPSLAETSFIACPHCGGTGHLRSTESAAIQVLRGVEEEASKRRAAEVVVHVALPIAMYVLNHKRERLAEIESRYGLRVTFAGDDTMIAPQFRIERIRAQLADAAPAAIRPEAGQAASIPAFAGGAVPVIAPDEEAAPADETTEASEEEEREDEEAADQAEAGANGDDGDDSEEAERRKRRRRRRRRGRRDEPVVEEIAAPSPAPAVEQVTGSVAAEDKDDETGEPESHVEGVPEHAEAGEQDARGRRRGRRGGRRRRREDGDALPEVAAPGAQQPDLPPLYVGPTPADPFGGHAFEFFDALERAEQQREAAPLPPVALPSMAEPSVAPEPALDRAPEPQTSELMPVSGGNAPEAAMAEPAQRAETWDQPVEAETVPAPQAGGPPAPQPVGTSMPASEARPATPTPANDSIPEPAIRPIVIGAEEAPPIEKKRGWWRR